MKRRTFLQSGACAVLVADCGNLSARQAEATEARKPWPRPPVKKLHFDETATPTFSKMAALTPLPGTKRIYLQQPCDYKIVIARPDLKFQIYNAINPTARSVHATGYGFVIAGDSAARSFDYRRTEQHFESDRLPLLTQRISQDGFDFEQKSFTTTDVQGRPLLMVRLTVTRRSSQSPRNLELGWLTVRDLHGRFYSHTNEDYIVFEPWGPAWESGLRLTAADNSQRDGETLFNVFKCGDNVSAGFRRRLAGAGLIFHVSFQERGEALIDLAIPYEGLQHPFAPEDRDLCYEEGKAFPLSEEKRLLTLSFDDEYRRQAGLWTQRLKDATVIDVPEKVVKDIYCVLTCNNLQFLGSARGVPYLKPGQGGFNTFSTVYGWESSNYLPIMDRQGFHDEVGRVLDYFLTTQEGHKGPQGDISTAEGSFRPYIHWMCETGAILGIFADHALFSGAYDRLRRDSAALLKAARWIQGQRARTKDILPNGTKSVHYGLMPPGRATDWPEFAYSLFTDAYTWRGMDKLAQAFERAGLPDATWLRAEADDYRQCVVASMKSVLTSPGLRNSSKQEQEKGKPVLVSEAALLEVGLIEAREDLVSEIEGTLRASGGMDDLFAQRMPQMEDGVLLNIQEQSAGGEIDLYYVNSSEKVWHRLWLERGERTKALRYFYTTLAYSTSRDVHVVSERFCPQLIWLLPWQPNASGNGRILEMMFNTLCLEDGDSMKLLQGVPDAWFATKQPLGVERLRTSFGVLSFAVKPASGSRRYELSYECTKDISKRFSVALPDGGGPQSRRVVEVDTRKLKAATFLLDAGTGSVSLLRR